MATLVARSGTDGDDAGPIPVAADAIAGAAGWPEDGPRAAAVARSLVADGLAVVAADGTLQLP